MKQISVLGIIIMLFSGCSSKIYENQEHYKVKVGERVEIYYTTNSCCYYCLSNQDDLKHVDFQDRKMIQPGETDCDGCDYTAAFVFEAKSIGIDTINVKYLVAAEECDNNDVDPIQYIIEVE